jgi:hypothetical protein
MLSFDFDETYSVCRAFNSKQFDKKKFSKSFCFDTDTVKILNAVKGPGRVRSFSRPQRNPDFFIGMELGMGPDHIL